MPGQTLTQEPQPVQSSVEIVITKFMPVIGLLFTAAGAAASSSSVIGTGRITACGQTMEQKVHWMQFSGIHFGTSTATPRFS